MTVSPSHHSLPVANRRVAVALATIGYHLTPKAYRNEKSGTSSVQWSLESRAKATVEQAHRLLDSVSDPDPRQRLSRRTPEHPYLVCLYYQEAVDSLRVWLRTGRVPSVLPNRRGDRLMRAVHGLPPGTLNTLSAPPPSDFQAVAALADPLHAAAALILGFVLSPHLTPEGKFLASASSGTFPGLTMRDLAAITSPSTHVLGIYGPGDHPACYALQCAQNLAHFDNAERLALRNPVHMMRGYGTRSALISEAIISARDAAHRDRLRLHLAGLT